MNFTKTLYKYKEKIHSIEFLILKCKFDFKIKSIVSVAKNAAKISNEENEYLFL